MQLPDGSTLEAIAAARDAAWWAGSSALAAWLIGLTTLFLNGGGLFFIWRQLKSTEAAARAAKAAAEVALLGERPWMKVTVASAEAVIRKRAKDLDLALRIRFDNIGKTPAIFTVTFVEISADDTDDGVEALIKKVTAKPIPFGRTVFPGDSVEDLFTVKLTDESSMPWSVVVGCEYEIFGDVVRRRTAEVLMVSKGHGLAASDRMYPDMAVAWRARLTGDHFVRIDPT